VPAAANSMRRPRARWRLIALCLGPLILSLGLVRLLGAAAAEASAAALSRAAPITVCSAGCDFVTLPPAIDAATSGGVIAVGPGVYTGTIHIEDSLTIMGAGRLSTTLDGAGRGPVLAIRPSTEVTIAHLTISNGLALVVDGHARGGGIFNLGSLHLLDVTIANNAARATPGPDGAYNGTAYGGGIFNGCVDDLCGQLWLENSIVINNLARGSDNAGDQDGGDAYGGGLYSDCSATACAGLLVSQSVFNENAAQGGNGHWPNLWPMIYSGDAYGGALSIGCGLDACPTALDSEMVIIEATIRGNSAAGNTDCDGSDGLGGGIHNAGRLVIETSTIDANRTIRGHFQCVPGYGRPFYPQGGGVFNSGVLLIDRSTVSNNRSQGHGGGIVNQVGGRVGLVNSTVSGNDAWAGNGGGILNEGRLNLTYSTIFGNSAIGGVRNWQEGGGLKNSGVLSMTGSTISGNRAYNYEIPDRGPDCWGPLQLQGYNHVGDATDCELLGLRDSDIVGGDALLHSLADYGGPTWTHIPTIFSPLLDAADPLDCPAIDQRGQPRPSGDSGRCDIGAVEGYAPLAYRFFFPVADK
jgi:hypothetical protein